MSVEKEDLAPLVFDQRWEELAMVYILQRMEEIKAAAIENTDHERHLQLMGKFSAFQEIYTLKTELEDSKHSDSSPS